MRAHLGHADPKKGTSAVGVGATPSFVVETVMAELLRLLPRSQGPLCMLDQSIEAGHFALAAMGRLDRHRIVFFGVDRDPVAIAMARRLVKGFQEFCDPGRFSFRSAVGDSLFGELPRGWPQRFHCVVGNPPWKATDRRVMGLMWDRYSPPLEGQFDAYLPFILRAHERVASGGLISLVVPSSFLSNLNAEPVRRLFLEKYEILSLVLFPRRSFIEIPCIVPIALTARKRGDSEGRAPYKTRVFYHPIGLGGVRRPRLDLSGSLAPIWQRMPACVFHPLVRRDTEFLIESFDAPTLNSFGMLRGSRLRRMGGKTLVAPFAGFRARDVRAFHACARQIERFTKGCRQFERPPDTLDISRPKVVFKDVRCVTIPIRLVAAALGPGEFGIGSCSVFVPTDEAHNDFFVALLNSCFANAWYKSRDLCRAIKFSHLKNLPVPVDLTSWARISQATILCSQTWNRVHNCMPSCREGDEDLTLKRVCPQEYADLTDLRREIDHTIFDIFEFSPRQRRAICRLSGSRVL